MKKKILIFCLSWGLLFGQSWAQSIPQVAGYLMKNASYKGFICLGSGNSDYEQGTTPARFIFTPVDESGNTVLISNGGQSIDPEKLFMSYDPTKGFAWSGFSETAQSDSAYMWVIEAATNDTNAILRSENPPLYTIRSAIKDGSKRAYLGAFFTGQNPASGNLDVVKTSGSISYSSENAKAFWFLKKADLMAYEYGIKSNIYADSFQQILALPQATILGESAPKFTTTPNTTLGLQYFSKWGMHNFVYSAGNKTYTASCTASGNFISYSSQVEYQSTDSVGFKGWAVDTQNIYFTDRNYMKYAQFGTEGIIDSFKIGLAIAGPDTIEYSNPVIWTDGKAWVVDSYGILYRYGGHGSKIPQSVFDKLNFLELILYDDGAVGYFTRDRVFTFRHMDNNVLSYNNYPAPRMTKNLEQRIRMHNNRKLNYPNTWVNFNSIGTRPFQFITQYCKLADWKTHRVAVCQYDSILHSSQLVYLKMEQIFGSFLCTTWSPKGQELVLLGDSMRPITTASNPVFYSDGKKEDGSTQYYLAVVALDRNGNYQLRQYKLPDFKEAGAFNSELSYECNMEYVTNPKLQKLAKLKANIENLDGIANRWHNDSQTEITNKQVRKLFEGYFNQIMQLPYNSYSFQKDWNSLYYVSQPIMD